MITLVSNMTVRSLATDNIAYIAPEATVCDALIQMNKVHANELLIGTPEDIQGIVTLNDLTMSENLSLPQDFDTQLNEHFLREVMTIDHQASAEHARDIMRANGVGRLVITENGKVIGLVRTINILNRFYGQIEQIRDTYASILNEIHEGVCVVDINGTVITWSKHASRLYNVAPEDIIGQPISKFFPSALISQVLKTKQPVENTIHSPRAGTVVNLSAVPLYNQDEMIGVLSTDRDITEVMNLTSELQTTKERLEYLEYEVSKVNRGSFTFNTVIGKSDQIMRVIRVAATVAASSTSVMIHGESGTGKEVIARSIHVASGREGLFVPINCSAIPESLFESEMFGYVAGAFTGALNKGKVGKFELANNGTLFLDEVGDMPLSMQAKLLRVIQDRLVTRIGDNQLIPTKVRIICATNKDLKKMVEDKTFREDLFYRLNVVSLVMPPLRERPEDIPLFVNQFINDICVDNNKPVYQIDSDVMDCLIRYQWPGNIRELRNVIEQLVIFAKDRITLNLLPSHIYRGTSQVRSTEQELQANAEALEIAMIKSALTACQGNKTLAANKLGISRPTLYYKLKKYNIPG